MAISRRIQTSTKRLVGWHGAWAAATLLMAFGPGFIWHKALVFTLPAVGLDFVMGVGMVLATKRYVMELDELQQRVWLNALGITVGVVLIVGVPYAVLNAYHAIPFRANFGHLVMLMGLTFVASLMYGTWRYR